MSAIPPDQYVFGSHLEAPVALSQGDNLSAGSHSPARRPTPSTTAWTVREVNEVPADDELSFLCRAVDEALPPATRSAVVLVPPTRPVDQLVMPTAASIATSSAATTAVVRIELLLQEGPVPASLTSGAPTLSSRLAEDERWPRFARAVPAHDTLSAAAVPIPLNAALGSGVLAAYSQDEAAFDPRDLRVLTAFARVVANIVGREALASGAGDDEKPETRPLVNQAIGVLITHHCDEKQAMRRLARISATTQQPIEMAAQMIVREAQAEAHLNFVARSPR